MQSSTIVLLLLCIVGPSLQQEVATGYITKTEYKTDGCTPSNGIRTMSFRVNTCNPTFSVIARYNPGNPKPFSLQYFSDSQCQVPTTQEFHVEDGCEVGTLTAVNFKYATTMPATEGLYSYAAYDPTKNACDGEVFFFQQIMPNCYLNNYGDYRSQLDTCSNNAGTTLRCYDTECKNCSLSNADLSNICDANSHARSSCGGPAGGATNPTSSPTNPDEPTSGTPGSTPTPTPTATSDPNATPTPTSRATPAPEDPSSSSAYVLSASAVVVLIAVGSALL